MDIICNNIDYQYNKGTKFATYALKKVSLTIKEGEFFGIIGHTGSGKSTFIQHLNALIPIQSGQITIGDYNLFFEPTKKRESKKQKKRMKSKLKDLRRTVGMVFQYPEYQLFADTVKEDVSFAIKNFMPETSEAEVEILTKNAIEMVGLNYFEIKDKSPFEISGGQKRRVAIAGVLAARPQILVLDEPCAGLDPKGKNELWQLLHRLHRDVIKTIIIVSHDMNDVANHCTSSAIFDHGVLKKVGTPKQLFSDQALITECGLEVPVTAYLTNELSKNGIILDTDFTTDDFCEKLANAIKNQK